jgi:hypothetical protein
LGVPKRLATRLMDVLVVHAHAAREGDRLSAPSLFQGIHLGSDLAERFIPARAAPLAFAARACAQQRIVEAAGVVELLDRGGTRLGAELAAVDRVGGIAFDLGDDAVLQSHDRAAAAVAVAAHGLELGHRGWCVHAATL